MIAVTFAVPHESSDLRTSLRHASPVGSGGWLLGNIGLEEIILLHAGIGPVAARENVARLLAEFSPRWLLCAGYAGGLEPSLRHAEVFAASNFSAPELLARWPGRRATLTTQAEAIDTVPGKLALAQTTGAQAVDMETGAIAHVCRERGLPMLSLRAISDTAAERIPVPLEASYDLVRQRPRIAALLRFLVKNPEAMLPFGAFVAGLERTRKTLTEAILATLAEDAMRVRGTMVPAAAERPTSNVQRSTSNVVKPPPRNPTFDVGR